MVVACPPLGGPGVRRCGCRPRNGSRRGLRRRRSPGGDQLAVIIKNRLKRIQYQPALIEAFLAQTGLTLGPQPP